MSAVMTMGEVTIGALEIRQGELTGRYHQYPILRDGKKIGEIFRFEDGPGYWHATFGLLSGLSVSGSASSPAEAVKDALSGGVKRLIAAANKAFRMSNRDNSDIFDAVQGIK